MCIDRHWRCSTGVQDGQHVAVGAEDSCAVGQRVAVYLPEIRHWLCACRSACKRNPRSGVDGLAERRCGDGRRHWRKEIRHYEKIIEVEIATGTSENRDNACADNITGQVGRCRAAGARLQWAGKPDRLFARAAGNRAFSRSSPSTPQTGEAECVPEGDIVLVTACEVHTKRENCAAMPSAPHEKRRDVG